MDIVSKEEARERGLKRYFTGKPCKNGHVAERFTTGGGCVECVRASVRRWRKANLEKARENTRQWIARNPERHRENVRKWHKENVERNREKARQWIAKNPERHRENVRKWREENPDRNRERQREWRQANPDRLAELSAGRRAWRLKATPAWADREVIAFFYSVAREETERTGEQHHVDHIVPLRGKNVCGLHVEANLQILTASQNLRKNNKLNMS